MELYGFKDGTAVYPKMKHGLVIELGQSMAHIKAGSGSEDRARIKDGIGPERIEVGTVSRGRNEH